MTDNPISLFEGTEIRILLNNVTGKGEPWFPLTDLATAWGVDPAAPYHIVERNPEVFKGFSLMSCDIDVTATSGRCVNEQGLYLLMGKISAGRLKNPEAKTAIIRFQRWVPHLIQRYRKREIQQIETQPKTPESVFAQARSAAKLCHKDPDAFLAIALKECGMEKYVPALSSPSIVHGEPGWYNPTELARLCTGQNLNAEMINHYLENNPRDPERRPFQYRDENRLWRLTPLGMEHGREYVYTGRGGHQEPRIEWRESILIASGLRRTLSPDQARLTAGGMQG